MTLTPPPFFAPPVKENKPPIWVPPTISGPVLAIEPEKKIITENADLDTIRSQSFNHLSTTPAGKLQDHRVMKLWQKKPKYFFEDVMDVKLDLWQEEVVELYLNHQRVAMVASKGPGKTATLAFIGWHFFITNNLPKVAALSISKEHLMSALWAELLKWRSRSKLLQISTIDGMDRIKMKGHESYSFIDA